MSIIKRAGMVAAALLIAGEASAIDMCFEGGTKLFVAKSYRRPARGRCQPLTGYEGSTTDPYPASGTVCLNAAGTTLYAHWIAMPGDTTLVMRMTIPYPALTGGASLFSTIGDTGTSVNGTGAQAFKCAPAPIP